MGGGVLPGDGSSEAERECSGEQGTRLFWTNTILTLILDPFSPLISFLSKP